RAKFRKLGAHLSKHTARLRERMWNVATVSGLAAALEHLEASDHLERVLQNAHAIAAHEFRRVEHSRGGAPHESRAVVVEDAALDCRRDEFIGVAGRQEYGEVLRGRRHERILKIYDLNSRAVLDEQVVAVVVAMREHAWEAIEPRGHPLQLGCDG